MNWAVSIRFRTRSGALAADEQVIAADCDTAATAEAERRLLRRRRGITVEDTFTRAICEEAA